MYRVSRLSLPSCDRLESRVFFSLASAQTVAADKAQLSADEGQLKSDTTGISATVVADRTLLKTDFNTELTAASNQLKSDQSTANLAIKSDQANGALTLKSDRATILADRKAIVVDRKNPVAEQADLAKLVSDRVILTNDTANLKATIVTDKSTWAGMFSTDKAGIAAVHKHGTALLTADTDQLNTDLKSKASIVFAEGKVIAADEARLAKDEAVVDIINLL